MNALMGLLKDFGRVWVIPGENASVSLPLSSGMLGVGPIRFDRLVALLEDTEIAVIILEC